MDTAVKVKFAMLLEHNQRPGEFGYNETATHYFETEGEFFDAWGETLPCGLPQALEGGDPFVIHKRFGTLYVDESGTPVACVAMEECPVEEVAKAARR